MFPFSVTELGDHFGSAFLHQSFIVWGRISLWMMASGMTRRLAVLAPEDEPLLDIFDGEVQHFGLGYVLKQCPLSASNAAVLRQAIPWLRPALLGLAPSMGFGDRLGLATPGHVQAVLGSGLAPVFAQQSVRENTRTRRTPQRVMDDATWGVFHGGWRRAWGADADHLKTPADIDAFVDAGFTLYTIDPGEFVDHSAHTASMDTLKAKVAALPWDSLDDSLPGLKRRYLKKTFNLEKATLTFDLETLLRAAAKYGRAIVHVHEMYRHLAAKNIPFELEVSVDETETPTSPAEHWYIASELKRLEVSWVSLAPRFVGRFEKGVDYIGDLEELRQALSLHAAVTRALGPYKLSLHSGSDKFSVYPLIAEATQGLVHVKTAGTSYLEALRVIACWEPDFFRDLLVFCRQRYEHDRVSYHVSAEVGHMPDPIGLSVMQLAALLEDFDTRQVLHVAFGSVLDQFGLLIHEALLRRLDEYSAGLHKHFGRHIEPFLPYGRKD